MIMPLMSFSLTEVNILRMRAGAKVNTLPNLGRTGRSERA